jgi:hypothetical protein
LNALGEVGVLEHVGRLQVFVIDHIVRANERKRRLVVEVLPLAAHRLMRFRQQLHGLAPAVAALFAPRDSALRCFQRPLGFAIPARRKDARPIRDEGRDLRAEEPG